MENHFKPLSLLLVEDSEADVELVKFCLKKNKLHLELIVHDNGEDALNYIFKENEYREVPTPDLVLLDINLPGMNGIEFLQKVKENEKTKAIPIVMLTSSNQDTDIIKSYSNHANCFLQKPLDLTSFQKIINTFENFWLSIVTLPTYATNN